MSETWLSQNGKVTVAGEKRGPRSHGQSLEGVDEEEEFEGNGVNF